MRAASRAVLLAIAVTVTVLGGPAPADAQTPAPLCPATVDRLPLSFSAPFSGTVRRVDGGASSLLCAYGEGVEPSAEISVTWSDGCGESTTVVASGVRAQPFQQTAADLVDEVGGACPPSEATTFPVLPVAAGAATLVLVIAAVLLRRRRGHAVPAKAPTADPAPEVAPALPAPETDAPVASADPEPEPEPAPEPTPEPRSEPAPEVPAPSLEPVLAVLEAPSGRTFARSAAGQWATVAALAYGSGAPEAGDLARTSALQGPAGRRLPRRELAVLAERLAHPGGGDDR